MTTRATGWCHTSPASVLRATPPAEAAEAAQDPQRLLPIGLGALSRL